MLILIGEVVVIGTQLGVTGEVVALGRAPRMVDTDEGTLGRLIDIPPSEVGLIGRWDRPERAVSSAGKPLDTQQAHIGILIVADKAGSAQALLLRGAHVALTQGALEAEEEDGRRGIAVHSAKIAEELKEIVEAVCRGQDVRRAVGAGVVDERTRAGAGPADDEKERATALLPRIGIGDSVGRTAQRGKRSTGVVIERLPRLGEILRATSTAEVAEAVEERIKSEGELQLVSARPLGIFVLKHQRLGIDGSDL